MRLGSTGGFHRAVPEPGHPQAAPWCPLQGISLLSSIPKTTGITPWNKPRNSTPRLCFSVSTPGFSICIYLLYLGVVHRTFSLYTDPRKDPLRKQGFLGSGKAGWAQEVPECDSELWRDPRVPSAGAVAWIKSQNLRLQRAAAPPHGGEGTGTGQGGWIPCSGHT